MLKRNYGWFIAFVIAEPKNICYSVFGNILKFRPVEMFLVHMGEDFMLRTYIMLLRLELERSQSKLDKGMCCFKF